MSDEPPSAAAPLAAALAAAWAMEGAAMDTATAAAASVHTRGTHAGRPARRCCSSSCWGSPSRRRWCRGGCAAGWRRGCGTGAGVDRSCGGVAAAAPGRAARATARRTTGPDRNMRPSIRPRDAARALWAGAAIMVAASVPPQPRLRGWLPRVACRGLWAKVFELMHNNFPFEESCKRAPSSHQHRYRNFACKPMRVSNMRYGDV
jgi:hypothetical protein